MVSPGTSKALWWEAAAGQLGQAVITPALVDALLSPQFQIIIFSESVAAHQELGHRGRHSTALVERSRPARCEAECRPPRACTCVG